MNQEYVANKVIEIIAENADYDQNEIHMEDRLMNDLSLTSMDLLNMIPEIEKEFSIKISEKMIRSFATVQNIVDCILANK